MESPDCPSIEQWDEFLLSGSAFSDSLLTGHLKDCRHCQATVQWRRDLLAMLETAVAGAEPFADCIRGFRKTHELSSNQPQYVMAAQSEVSPSQAERSISLISADGLILVKAVCDSRTREAWLYVIAENPAVYRNVLVRPFGDDREYLTDENGRVKLGDGTIDEILPDRAEIHLPKAVFRLGPIEQWPRSEAETTLTTSAGDEIKLSMINAGQVRGLRVEIVQLAHRVADQPIRIAVREAGGLRARFLSPSETFMPSVVSPDSSTAVEIFLFQ